MRTPFSLLFLFVLVNFMAGQINSAKVLHSYASDLPKSQIYDIIQDHDGFVWIGTRDGLLRSDGLQLIQFNAEDGLGFNYCADFVIDEKEQLWIASRADYKGVSKLNLKTHQMTHFPFLSQDSLDNLGKGITAISIAKNQNLLFLSADYQLFEYDGTVFINHTLQDLIEPESRVVQIADFLADPVDADACWIANHNGLIYYDRMRSRVTYPFTNNQTEINDIFYHAELGPYLWVGLSGSGGLLQLDLRDHKVHTLY
ncbi:MAG: hypothetical protein HKN76_05730, partial [Saprospiraceae bacterium]|nr:hypothetical protein [Saprospiraceae bacterium]